MLGERVALLILIMKLTGNLPTKSAQEKEGWWVSRGD